MAPSRPRSRLPASLSPGAVFRTKWDRRPFRVLTFDDVEVMYDAWWPHSKSWGLTSFKRSASYYRMPTKQFLQKAKHLRDEPFTGRELAVHRPDLPLRLCRSAKLQWSISPPATVKAFRAMIGAQSPRLLAQLTGESMNVDAIHLVPFGPKGGTMKGALIHAGAGGVLSALELLWYAFKLQAYSIGDLPNGIGLYRLGCQAECPSFYLWGSRDKAEFIEEEPAV